MYFDNTWLTYCLLIAIIVFFVLSIVAAIYTYYVVQDRIESKRINMEAGLALRNLENQEDELYDLKQYYTQQVDRINQRLN